MAKYHCPQCRKELKKEKYAKWVGWWIGPIFGRFLKPLVCDEHGVINIKTLSTEERESAVRRKWIGIVGGLFFNILFLILIILSLFYDF